MPKSNHKPNKGLLKRVKLTARGKAKKHRSGSSHLLSSKSGKRRRRLRKPNLLPKSGQKKVLRMAGLR